MASSTPTIRSLQALLSKPNSDPSTSSSDPFSTSTSTFRGPIPGGWSDTVTSGFGVIKGKSKGKQRATLGGLFEAVEENEGHETARTEQVELRKEERRMRDEKERKKGREVDVRAMAERVVQLAQPSRTRSTTIAEKTIIVICPCHLPSQATLDKSHGEGAYMLLWTCLRERLEVLSGGGEYSIVLLTNPTPNAPSTATLIREYLHLSRAVRKGLQRTWVVGGGWWIKVLLTLFTSTLLSTKFSQKKKLVLVNTLGSLAKSMGASDYLRVEVPVEVYLENMKTESSIVLPLRHDESQGRVFGVELEKLTGTSAEMGLPKVVTDCIGVIEASADAEGIFRRSPSSAMVKLVREIYDLGSPIHLDSFPDAPFIAASILKLYLRELPLPLFSSPKIYDVIRKCPLPPLPVLFASSSNPPSSDPQLEPTIVYLTKTLIPLFKAPEVLLLSHLFHLLHLISQQSTTNLMDAENLTICLVPSLMGDRIEPMEGMRRGKVPATLRRVPGKVVDEEMTLGGVIKVFIDCYDSIFPSLPTTDLSSEPEPIVAPPLMSTDGSLSPSASSSSSLPSSPVLSASMTRSYSASSATSMTRSGSQLSLSSRRGSFASKGTTSRNFVTVEDGGGVKGVFVME